MKLRTLFLSIALVVVTALVTRRVVSQDATGGGGEFEVVVSQWMKYAQPGENHEHLGQFIGKWDQEVKMWMAPGAEPALSASEVEYKWILDGRFVVGEYAGTLNGSPFKGVDVLGYDNFRGEYIGLWMDNMTTAFMLSSGKYDPQTRSIAMKGNMDDVMTGRRGKPFRTETRFVGGNEFIYEMHGADASGKEFLALQVTAKRK